MMNSSLVDIDEPSLRHSSANIARSGEIPAHFGGGYESPQAVAPSFHNQSPSTSQHAPNINANGLSPDQQRISELQSTLSGQTARIQELELALSEARKLIQRRENLLQSLQWDPKDDFYANNKPNIADKSIREFQEKKLKALIEQMHIMESTLIEKDKRLSASLAMSQGLARDPTSYQLAFSQSVLPAGSPMLSPNAFARASPGGRRALGQSALGQSSAGPRSPKTPKWGQSSVASPAMGSPRVKKSGSWWFGGRKNSIVGGDNGASTSTPNLTGPQSSRAKSSLVV